MKGARSPCRASFAPSIRRFRPRYHVSSPAARRLHPAGRAGSQRGQHCRPEFRAAVAAAGVCRRSQEIRARRLPRAGQADRRARSTCRIAARKPDFPRPAKAKPVAAKGLGKGANGGGLHRTSSPPPSATVGPQDRSIIRDARVQVRARPSRSPCWSQGRVRHQDEDEARTKRPPASGRQHNPRTVGALDRRARREHRGPARGRRRASALPSTTTGGGPAIEPRRDRRGGMAAAARADRAVRVRRARRFAEP